MSEIYSALSDEELEREILAAGFRIEAVELTLAALKRELEWRKHHV